MSLHAQRGQTFPIWAFGTLTVLTMLVLALSYGQMVMWQMRAQNAADAAAKGMLSVQTTQWNESEAALHAAAVEEYRLRVIMNDLLEVIRDSGGCAYSDSDDDTDSEATSASTGAYLINASADASLASSGLHTASSGGGGTGGGGSGGGSGGSGGGGSGGGGSGGGGSGGGGKGGGGGGGGGKGGGGGTGGGGTGGGGTGSGGSGDSCATLYANLRQAYLDSLQRYTNDVEVLGQISWPTWSEQVTQIQSALAQYQANCGTSSGGDCAFNYTLVEVTPRPATYLEDVYADCCYVAIGGGTSSNPKQDLTPMEIEIVACANVHPWLPNFWHWDAPTYQAMGRAAATSVMDTQEFMWVGSLTNPTSSSDAVFQPPEYPESTDDESLGYTDDDEYYAVNFGYSPSGGDYYDASTSNGTSGFTTENFTYPGLLIYDGWWTAMRIAPIAGQLTSGTSYTCSSNG